MKWRFAVKFLVVFAVLTVLWAGSDFGIHYRTAVLAVVQVLSPAVNGWMLEHDQRDAIAASVTLGTVLYFASNVIFLLVYPLIMDRPNAIKDTLGVFSGLIVVVM